jgi:hypothetical protein
MTKPTPFSFTQRDAMPKESIESKKFQQYLAELKAKENAEYHHVFHAKPVSAAILAPKYDALMSAQEQRRQEVKAKAQEILMKTQRPFQFSEPKPAKPEQLLADLKTDSEVF